jgi:hypothetical protein
MQAGSHVAYVKDPSLYGPMEVTQVRRDGRLECMALSDDAVYDFAPAEVDDAGKFFITPRPGALNAQATGSRDNSS